VVAKSIGGIRHERWIREEALEAEITDLRKRLERNKQELM